MSCVDCHKFHDAGELGMAPDLTGYMSRSWMIDFIKNPTAERFYGDNNDRMPSFAPHDDPRLNQLDDKSLGLIVDWLRGDWVCPRPRQIPRPSDASTIPILTSQSPESLQFNTRGCRSPWSGALGN